MSLLDSRTNQDEIAEGTMDSISSEPKRESVWKRIYRDNKGAILILLAEVAGSSMDAIVRYLQQGRERGMHPFQVRFLSVILITRVWTS
jgi:hypothetical protein